MGHREKVNFQRGDNLWALLDKAGFKPTEIPGHLESIAKANGLTVKALNDIASDRRLWISKAVADELPPGMIEPSTAQERAAADPVPSTTWWRAVIFVLLLVAAYGAYWIRD
jgi:hypothetical protein